MSREYICQDAGCNLREVDRILGYDSHGRSISTEHRLRNSRAAPVIETYLQRQTYDQHSRPFQSFDLAFQAGHPDAESTGERRLGVQYVYNQYGYQSEVRNARIAAGQSIGELFYRTLEVNARGQVVRSARGANTANPDVETIRSYDTRTGLLTGLLSTVANTSGRTTVQDWTYRSYDVVGNLGYRYSATQNRVECFAYDGRNRLESSTVYASSNCFSGAVQSTQTQQYNGFGNLKFKSDVGSYGYQPGTGRVTSVTGTTNESFAYDNMGNQTSQLINGVLARAISYTPNFQPEVIDSLTTVAHPTNPLPPSSTSYIYGPGRELIERTDRQGGTVQSHVLYLGGVEIERGANPNVVTYRRQLGFINDDQRPVGGNAGA